MSDTVALAGERTGQVERPDLSGVEWSQALAVFKALLFSPFVGFVAFGVLLLVMKMLVRRPELYEAPAGSRPPPPWIRALPILTCTGELRRLLALICLDFPSRRHMC